MPLRCLTSRFLRATALAACAFVLGTAVGTEAIFAEQPNYTALLEEARKSFQPLPKDAATREFPVSSDRVNLGRMLFFDPRISVDGTGSCMHCHQPALYGADALPKSHGVHDQIVPRNAPTVFNAALQFKVPSAGFLSDFDESDRETRP